MANLEYQKAMRDRFALEPDTVLWLLLDQVAHLFHKALETEIKPYGISLEQAAALAVINAIGDGATTGEVAQWLFLTPHSVSEMLTRMQKNGLVNKITERVNKRRKTLTLTAKGRQILEQTQKMETIHRLMSHLTEEQRQQMSSSLVLLRDKAIQDLALSKQLLYP